MHQRYEQTEFKNKQHHTMKNEYTTSSTIEHFGKARETFNGQPEAKMIQTTRGEKSTPKTLANMEDDMEIRRSKSSQHGHVEMQQRSKIPSMSTSVSSGAGSREDREGMIEVQPGDYLCRRQYRVLGTAGQGTFGTVLHVLETATGRHLAIKVVRSVKRYLTAAKTEAALLNAIKRADPYAQSLCVRMESYFEFRHCNRQHAALVFEKLGRSLYSFIKKNNYLPYTPEHVRDFAYQLLTSIAFCHKIRLIHTDLKPENILLVNSEYTVNKVNGEFQRVPLNSDIRLIDFGGSVWEWDHHSSIVQTRQYRAPEVVFGLHWSFPVDLWSVGAILSELATGNLLFATHDDAEHIQLMERVLGQQIPPVMVAHALRSAQNGHKSSPSDRSVDDLISSWHSKRRLLSANQSLNMSWKPDKIDRSSRSPSTPRMDKIFDLNTGKQLWPASALDMDSIRHVAECKTLEQLHGHQPQLLDLLKGLLQIDPAKRLDAEQALRHPYFDPIRQVMQQCAEKRKQELVRGDLLKQKHIHEYQRNSRSTDFVRFSPSDRHNDSRGGDLSHINCESHYNSRARRYSRTYVSNDCIHNGHYLRNTNRHNPTMYMPRVSRSRSLLRQPQSNRENYRNFPNWCDDWQSRRRSYRA